MNPHSVSLSPKVCGLHCSSLLVSCILYILKKGEWHVFTIIVSNIVFHCSKIPRYVFTVDTNKQLHPQLSLRRHFFPSSQPKDCKNSSGIHVGEKSPCRMLEDVNGACGAIPSIPWSLAWENNKSSIGSVISLIWTTVNLFYITAQPLRILHWVSFY